MLYNKTATTRGEQYDDIQRLNIADTNDGRVVPRGGIDDESVYK